MYFLKKSVHPGLEPCPKFGAPTVKVLLFHSWHHFQQEITAGDAKDFLRSLSTCSFLKFHDAVLYLGKPKWCMSHMGGSLAAACYWFPADSFSFLPPLRGELTLICQDGNQLQSGNQPEWKSWWRNRSNKSIWTPELYHFPDLSCGIAQCRLCNSSFPTNPGNLSQMQQHWIPPQRWSWITQWLAKTTLAGSSPKKGIRNWQLTQQGQTQPHVRVPLSPGLSQKPGSSSHVQGQQGLGLFIVSVTSRSFLHLFS